MQRSSWRTLGRIAAAWVTLSAAPPLHTQTVRHGNTIYLDAGILHRRILLGQRHVRTTSLLVGQTQMLAAPNNELAFDLHFASPDRRPRALPPGEGGSLETQGGDVPDDLLSAQQQRADVAGGISWLQSRSRPDQLCGTQSVTTSTTKGLHHLSITGTTCEGALAYALHYETDDIHPAIRKWVSITNPGPHWLKIDHLTIEPWSFSEVNRSTTFLTPPERGAGSSLVAMGPAERRSGVILGSEVPSALREINPSGSMGYTPRYFEWVLGPGETFRSECVFEYAFAGPSITTLSAVSTPLDRTVEGPFQRFLRDRVKLLTDAKRLPVPYFSTWSNFGPAIDDANIRQMADLASQAGFGILALDDGWQRGRLGTEVDTAKFPDFKATTQYVLAKGLRLGLWVSTFRSPGAKDLLALPDSASRPAIRRAGGFAMSFSGPWRDFFAHDLATLAKTYGLTYFKQDFSNVRFGDFAEGHESRTVRESLLRGLRGLLGAEDTIRREAPEVTLELTHEVYWGTPGVPCDLAALQHAHLFHIPPNEYLGDGNPYQRFRSSWSFDPATMRHDLIEGALHARERFYAHRGLPLDAIEFYGAATMNIQGSLSPQVQDRQIASWLMGAPLVFAGDLASLTLENLRQYKSRFDLLSRLQQTYDIYDYFEFSGVPSKPTDTDWQWWGKLNPEGFGAVVILRGEQGAESRGINIPWVQPGTQYLIHARLRDQALGQYSGLQLQTGALSLSLPPYGQEILELSPLQPGTSVSQKGRKPDAHQPA